MGWDHSYTVKADGTPACWGRNFDGQLGNGSTTNRGAPVTVTGLIDIVAPSLARHHSYAVTASDMVYHWGDKPLASSAAVAIQIRMHPIG